MGDSVARKLKELIVTKNILISTYDLNHHMICDLKKNEYVVDIEKTIHYRVSDADYSAKNRQLIVNDK